MNRRYLLVFLSILAILVVGCKAATSGYASSPSADIKEFNTAIQNFQYNPESINVNFPFNALDRKNMLQCPDHLVPCISSLGTSILCSLLFVFVLTIPQ